MSCHLIISQTLTIDTDTAWQNHYAAGLREQHMHQAIETTPFTDLAVSADQARALYRDMLRARRFDERAVSLQRQGWMSSYPPFRGQEASQIGVAHALSADDWLFPTYRSNALQLARGVPMSDILLFRLGYPEFASEHDIPHFPQAIPIATQLPHAVGAGMAMNYTADDSAVCCYFGDGATSEGDFHEALNMAGVFETPTVFFCENNGWAISHPRHRQTASRTIAQKASAYGFTGRQVDGNDPIAVLEVVSDALSGARAGEPMLIESLTYRQGAHSTSDDPERYDHLQESLPEWRTTDPLHRFERYLRAHGVLDSTQKEQFEEDIESELDTAKKTAESLAETDVDAVFEDVYESPSPRQQRQQAWLRAWTHHTDR